MTMHVQTTPAGYRRAPAGYSLAEDLRRTGLEAADLERLTGKDRRTVWRWVNGRSPVPDYVLTILLQQRRIKTLAVELARLTQRH